jgi:hypothetical protein
MPRLPPSGTIGAISTSSGKSVDVDALNFLLLGETDYNEKNPDNQFLAPYYPVVSAGWWVLQKAEAAKKDALDPSTGGGALSADHAELIYDNVFAAQTLNWSRYYERLANAQLTLNPGDADFQAAATAATAVVARDVTAAADALRNVNTSGMSRTAKLSAAAAARVTIPAITPSYVRPAFAENIKWFNKRYTNIGKPTTLEELFGALQRNHSAVLNKFLRQGAWKDEPWTVSRLISQIEKSIGIKGFGPSFSSGMEDYARHWQELKEELALNELNASRPGFINPQAQLNASNLHVALLYPGVAAYLKKVRSKLLNNAYAVRSPFFPNMSRGGITFQIQTGGAENIQNLNSAYPIEMRGFGHLIASSMKGGSFSGLSVGTVNSPTIWRPLTDDSYIGDSLITAVDKVKAKLQSLGIALDDSVNQKIAGRLSDLRNAEQAAKNYRDKLNIVARMNGPAGNGDGQVDWNNAGRNRGARVGEINDNDIDKLVTDYNRSMQQVVKNEGVVLKVLDQLGRVVAEHRV